MATPWQVRPGERQVSPKVDPETRTEYIPGGTMVETEGLRKGGEEPREGCP